MSLTLESIEERIKQYEAAIANSLNNHNAMVGALQELKNLLTIAVPVADALAPAVGSALQDVEIVVDAVDNAVMAAGNASEPSGQVPSAE